MKRRSPFILSKLFALRQAQGERRVEGWFDGLTMTGFLLAFVLAGLPGCSWARDRRRATELESEVQQLHRELSDAQAGRQAAQREADRLREDLRRAQVERTRERDRLIEEREWAVRHAREEKERESEELVEAERQLAEGLKKELGEARAKLAMTERGLVITFLDEVFFDSGKAVIKEEGKEALNKVAQVLKETVADSPVAVEGHTDNEPIKYSGWLSNWELSSGRALAVLHYFVETHSLAPGRLQAVAQGEFHPVASNDTPEGRRQNRRVEVVILPAALRKTKE